QLTGAWTTYPQLYWWEGPDGSRVLHWRTDRYADGPRFGFDVGAAEMAHHLTDWLLSDPVLAAPGYPYDVALLWGAAPANGVVAGRSSAAGWGATCCCSGSTPGARRQACRIPTGSRRRHNGRPSGASWSAPPTRLAPRSRTRCCASA